ncbi:hypothetical protein [Bosea sp. (in: a-proteobacteria)]|uniref:hypothetical protein n=1 Tax=Bosea sp. (in: a-proteobacteria) TaxID=1871050 RepID=UPI002B485EDD|nr:hypothetical protein [Bosea sp. (in: a-proteobacteria)]WRH57266.1 MAG: hypothetical protein RSE11_20090 [Bosea sp. (in: a-proteobacteria)]
MAAPSHKGCRRLPEVAHEFLVLTGPGSLDPRQGYDQRVDDCAINFARILAISARLSCPVGRRALKACLVRLWCLDASIHAVSIQEPCDRARACRSMRDVTLELWALSISFPRYFNEM